MSICIQFVLLLASCNWCMCQYWDACVGTEPYPLKIKIGKRGCPDPADEGWVLSEDADKVGEKDFFPAIRKCQTHWIDNTKLEYHFKFSLTHDREFAINKACFKSEGSMNIKFLIGPNDEELDYGPDPEDSGSRVCIVEPVVSTKYITIVVERDPDQGLRIWKTVISACTTHPPEEDTTTTTTTTNAPLIPGDFGGFNQG